MEQPIAQPDIPQPATASENKELPPIFALTMPDNQETIAQVTHEGQFFWNPKAAELIADNARWPGEYTGIRFLLKAVYNIEQEPRDSRAAFETVEVKIPGGYEPGTQEWVQAMLWGIWREGVAFGRRYLLQLDGATFQKLEPAVTAVFKAYETLAAYFPSGVPEEWKELEKAVQNLYLLGPNLQRLGKDCDHELLPVVDFSNPEKAIVTGYACVHCGTNFKVHVPQKAAAGAPEVAVGENSPVDLNEVVAVPVTAEKTSTKKRTQSKQQKKPKSKTTR